MNNNPTGKNQYTGSLRLKTGKFYHGTQNTFAGAVRPSKGDATHYPSSKAWASDNIKIARLYSLPVNTRQRTPRVLQVALPPKDSRLVKRTGSMLGTTVLESKRPLRVIKSLKLLKHRNV